MTRTQFNRAIRDLCGTHYKAAKALGISMRSIYAYSRGESPVPRDLGRLLRMMQHYHLTPSEAAQIWGESR